MDNFNPFGIIDRSLYLPATLLDLKFRKGRKNVFLLFHNNTNEDTKLRPQFPELRKHEMSEKKFDYRFGIVAVKKGLITRGQLLEALKTQLAENIKGMEHRLIGQILQAKNYLTSEQTDEVLIEMGLL